MSVLKKEAVHSGRRVTQGWQKEDSFDRGLKKLYQPIDLTLCKQGDSLVTVISSLGHQDCAYSLTWAEIIRSMNIARHL